MLLMWSGMLALPASSCAHAALGRIVKGARGNFSPVPPRNTALCASSTPKLAEWPLQRRLKPRSHLLCSPLILASSLPSVQGL